MYFVFNEYTVHEGGGGGGGNNTAMKQRLVMSSPHIVFNEYTVHEGEKIILQ